MAAVNFTIRRLEPEDIGTYKEMRLEALRLEPGVFGSSYVREAAFDDETWMKRLSNTDAAHFGLYADKKLIGITGIMKSSERAGDAEMIQSYIRPEHRGKKLSRLFYKARLGWAKENGVNRVIVGHGVSNTISRAANQQFGFTYTHWEIRDWPDGNREDILYYVLELG